MKLPNKNILCLLGLSSPLKILRYDFHDEYSEVVNIGFFRSACQCYWIVGLLFDKVLNSPKRDYNSSGNMAPLAAQELCNPKVWSGNQPVKMIYKLTADKQKIELRQLLNFARLQRSWFLITSSGLNPMENKHSFLLCLTILSEHQMEVRELLRDGVELGILLLNRSSLEIRFNKHIELLFWVASPKHDRPEEACGIFRCECWSLLMRTTNLTCTRLYFPLLFWWHQRDDKW